MSNVNIDTISLEFIASVRSAERQVNSLIRQTQQLSQAFNQLKGASTAMKSAMTAVGSMSKISAAYASAAKGAEAVKQAQERTAQAAIRTSALQQKAAQQQKAMSDSVAAKEVLNANKIAQAQEKTVATRMLNVQKLAKAEANTAKAETQAASAALRYANALNKVNNAQSKTQKSSFGLNSALEKVENFSRVFGTLSLLANGIMKFARSSADYTENLNLFAAQMGEFRGEADKVIDKMEQLLGIDPSEAMRYMGFFMQLTQSMGVASDKAFQMSKNLTQLGYDIASFINIDIDDAMLKLESGLAGKHFARNHRDMVIGHHCSVKAKAA